MIINIIAAVLSLGLMGLLFGLLLAVSAKVFAVEKDERIDLVVEELPGANCGGCGFASCANYAEAVVTQGARTNACPVGGDAVAAKVAGIMGVTAESTTQVYAKVKCSGYDDKVTKKYAYMGLDDCLSVMRLGGGDKGCPYSCIGLGTCAKKCVFGAITVRDGLAFVDRDKCQACGMCVDSCPKGIIELIPHSNEYWVSCSSRDRGPQVKKYCTVGCIGCKLCEKACEYAAIKVIDNVALIDKDKCTNCGACAARCPVKIIKTVETEENPKSRPKKRPRQAKDDGQQESREDAS